jgi:hypothetical protein
MGGSIEPGGLHQAVARLSEWARVEATDLPSFDELLDLLRARLGTADDVNLTEGHSFKTLMKHEADEGQVADHFYHRAFDELMAEGHLDPASSRTAMAFEAYGRLSADGRLYLKMQADES